MKVSVLLDCSPQISDYSPHLSHPTGKSHCQLKCFDLCCLGILGRNALSTEKFVLPDAHVLRKKICSEREGTALSFGLKSVYEHIFVDFRDSVVWLNSYPLNLSNK